MTVQGSTAEDVEEAVRRQDLIVDADSEGFKTGEVILTGRKEAGVLSSATRVNFNVILLTAVDLTTGRLHRTLHQTTGRI